MNNQVVETNASAGRIQGGAMDDGEQDSQSHVSSLFSDDDGDQGDAHSVATQEEINDNDDDGDDDNSLPSGLFTNIEDEGDKNGDKVQINEPTLQRVTISHIMQKQQIMNDGDSHDEGLTRSQKIQKQATVNDDDDDDDDSSGLFTRSGDEGGDGVKRSQKNQNQTTKNDDDSSGLLTNREDDEEEKSQKMQKEETVNDDDSSGLSSEGEEEGSHRVKTSLKMRKQTIMNALDSSGLSTKSDDEGCLGEGVKRTHKIQKRMTVNDDDWSGLFSKGDDEGEEKLTKPQKIQKQAIVNDDDSSGLFSKSDDEGGLGEGVERSHKMQNKTTVNDDDSSGLFSKSEDEGCLREGVKTSHMMQKKTTVNDDESSGLFSKSEDEVDEGMAGSQMVQNQTNVRDDDSSGLFSKSEDEGCLSEGEKRSQTMPKKMTVSDDDSSGLFSKSDDDDDEGVTTFQKMMKQTNVYDDDSSGIFSKSDEEDEKIQANECLSMPVTGIQPRQAQETASDDDSCGLFSRIEVKEEVPAEEMPVVRVTRSRIRIKEEAFLNDHLRDSFPNETTHREEPSLCDTGHGVVFPAPIKKQSRGSLTRFEPLEASRETLLMLSESTDQFFLRHVFDGKLIIKTIKLPSKKPLDQSFRFAGRTYSIVAVKHEKRDSKQPIWKDSIHGSKGYAKAFYVAMDHCELQKALNQLGDFAALQPPCKAASRLEMMVSPASTDKAGFPRVWLRNIDDFELIEENHHVGCGFIPVEYLVQLVGTADIAAIQVRIYSKALGHFKGMLMAKNRITRIQLPHSMLKVRPSPEKTRTDTDVFVLCNGVSPSNSSRMLNRHLNPNLANPPPSAIKDLRPMSPMIKSLMVLVGVPSEVVEKFSKDASQDWNRKHWAFCVGVADPTGCLPAGSIFVTGVGVGYDTANNKHQMFITRCPCTEPSDVKVLPVVSHKPASMPVEDWKHLCSISFGLVIFATPNGAAGCSLPESIADGDLDGDPYFLCWDQEILHISPERLMNTNDDVEDAQDDLIGQDVTTIKDGKLLHGITIRQDDQGGYLCDFLAHGRWSLTKSEVLGDRDFIVKIHDHRGLGVKAEILIEWQFASTPTWERIHGFRNDEANAQVVAEYARVQDLLGTRGWEWTKDFIRPSELAEILEHDERDGICKSV
ncbi:RNA-dependent RNA polymerase [Fragilaria crotonensis]|nr:RNA-dependent RNA polymerase [Fragilaria crotonensis]